MKKAKKVLKRRKKIVSLKDSLVINPDIFNEDAADRAVEFRDTYYGHNFRL